MCAFFALFLFLVPTLLLKKVEQVPSHLLYTASTGLADQDNRSLLSGDHAFSAGCIIMGDLQATLEVFVELNKFYNVDLFQRG